MRIEWTEPALADLSHIRDYIAEDSPIYATQFVRQIFNATDKLADFPRIGRSDHVQIMPVPVFSSGLHSSPD